MTDWPTRRLADDRRAAADREHVLDRGTVEHEGDAVDLLDDPEVSRLYLGG